MAGNARDGAISALMNLLKRINVQGSISQGVILSVDKNTDTCSVMIDDFEYIDVPLCVLGQQSNVVIYPVVGTECNVFFLAANEQAPSILNVQDVESVKLNTNADIIFNGGNNGGLINIVTLTEKINALVQAYNSHTHPVTTAGSATAQTGTAAATTATASTFSKSDYEDTKIKH